MELHVFHFSFKLYEKQFFWLINNDLTSLIERFRPESNFLNALLSEYLA